MIWEDLAVYARRSPSPHNTQPARLRVIDDETAEVWFVKDRGLPVGDPQGRFTHATFGIFCETLRIAAHASSYHLAVAYTGQPLYSGAAATQKVADLRLEPRADRIDDFDPALLLRRRTNRHPYDERPVPKDVVDELSDEAGRFGHSVHVATDDRAVEWVKELNRDALYHDLEEPVYRRELDRWLRYSESQARETRDGLSAGALAVPGALLKGMIHAHRLFTAPGAKQITQYAYMRTMRGIPTVGWVQGDFVDADDWTRAGHLMLRLWLILTRHGVEWQPYGSVITNDAARRSMVDKFGMREGEGGRDMVWLLVRMGYCDTEPVRSERLAATEIVQ